MMGSKRVYLVPILIALIAACKGPPTRHSQLADAPTLPYSNDNRSEDDSNGTQGPIATPSGGRSDPSANEGYPSSATPAPQPESPESATPEVPSPSTPIVVIPTTRPSAPTPPSDPLCYKADVFICQIEELIVAKTNQHRTNGALIQNMESSFVVREWSQTQADRNQISHDGFPAERKKALKAEFPSANWDFFAENVAMLQNNGNDANEIAQAFVEMWWDSPGHKANMIGNYKKIGVGVARKGNSYYATQIFY